MELKAFRNSPRSVFSVVLIVSSLSLLFVLHSPDPPTTIEPKLQSIGISANNSSSNPPTTIEPKQHSIGISANNSSSNPPTTNEPKQQPIGISDNNPSSNPPTAIESEQQSIGISDNNSSSNPPTTIEPKQQSIGISDNSSSSIAQPTGEEEEECDLFAGKWVRDAASPVYTNSTCTMMPDTRNCAMFGKGIEHALWRWKPDGCGLRRFDPVEFLSTVRGKKTAFVGDSLARNQMESLLCLLSQAATATPADIYNGYSKFQTWHYPSHDFTLMFIWAEFLVESKERTVNGTATDAFDLQLDRVNPVWAEKLPELHYLIISAGNWFIRKNYLYDSGGSLIGCVLCDEDGVKDLGLAYAIRRAYRTSLEHISRCKECDDNLVTLLRTYSPNHFENGGWLDGYCNRTGPLDESEADFAARHWDLRTIQVEEMGRITIKGENYRGKRRMGLLDVTKAMMLRADGHPGSFFNRRVRKATNSDCLHWCLPGPVDMWNDVLLATIKKKGSLL